MTNYIHSVLHTHSHIHSTLLSHLGLCGLHDRKHLAFQLLWIQNFLNVVLHLEQLSFSCIHLTNQALASSLHITLSHTHTHTHMQTHHTITHTCKHTHANTSHYHTQFKNCILVLLLGLRVHGLDLLNDDLWQPGRRNIQTSNNTSITQHPQTCQMHFLWTSFGNSSMAISAQMSLKTFLNESW